MNATITPAEPPIPSIYGYAHRLIHKPRFYVGVAATIGGVAALVAEVVGVVATLG